MPLPSIRLPSMSRLDFCTTIMLLGWQLYKFMPFFPVISLFTFPHIFSRPTSFLQKSSCRVSSEKNISNSSVGWSGVEWSGKIRLKLYLCLLSYTFSVLVYYRYCYTRRAWYIYVRYTEISKFNLFININTVTRGAHDIDIRTCVLWEFLTLTYCFV